MTEFLKGVGSVTLGAIAGAGLAAVSFFAIGVLMPPFSHVTEIQTHVSATEQSPQPLHVAKP